MIRPEIPELLIGLGGFPYHLIDIRYVARLAVLFLESGHALPLIIMAAIVCEVYRVPGRTSLSLMDLPKCIASARMLMEGVGYRLSSTS